MTKVELRKIYLARQKNLSPAERKQKSAQIAAFFFQTFDLSSIEFLHCFLPIENFGEIDTKLILGKIWNDFPSIETLAPRVNWETGEIESLRFSAQTELARNRWQIYEPARGEVVAAEKVDMVLVPLLCFDAQGFRVGYGKGFYDKFLQTCRPEVLKIGLSYFPAVAEVSDTRNFDVKLDYCVTPEKVWSFRKAA